eukprot:Blabericola_migrator_1__1777@NODE_1480_length_4456_cov_88_006380_g971_i0_p2_GENE_NODE_1480_length_4456_cov_88_006380_g971_i0NODE_1480_length_4456_cov_88_006380_g971_i0_p2_ORF_typecomplete_len441_score60_58Branch/PF02485_21/8_8e08_NODE_1480_length_4456_cov_88_006380_g971_i05771899
MTPSPLRIGIRPTCSSSCVRDHSSAYIVCRDGASLHGTMALRIWRVGAVGSLFCCLMPALYHLLHSETFQSWGNVDLKRVVLRDSFPMVQDRRMSQESDEVYDKYVQKPDETISEVAKDKEKTEDLVKNKTGDLVKSEIEDTVGSDVQTSQHTEPTKMIIMFLAQDGIYNPDIWDWWAQKAKADGVDVTGIVFGAANRTMSTESMPTQLVLRVLEGEEVEGVECAWGKFLHCMNALFEASYYELGAGQTDIDGQMKTKHWYILMSAQAVPVKSARHILTTLNQYPDKSWMAVSDWSFTASCPKHSQWIILNDAHMQFLVHEPLTWVMHGWARNRTAASRVAAPDEHRPGCAIMHEFGREAIHTLSEPNFIQGMCWKRCREVGITEGSHRPALFSSIAKSYFDKWLQNPHTFFGRKFLPDTLIVDDRQYVTTLTDYLKATI